MHCNFWRRTISVTRTSQTTYPVFLNILFLYQLWIIFIHISDSNFERGCKMYGNGHMFSIWIWITRYFNGCVCNYLRVRKVYVQDHASSRKHVFQDFEMHWGEELTSLSIEYYRLIGISFSECNHHKKKGKSFKSKKSLA